jgi:hypothetical protein
MHKLHLKRVLSVLNLLLVLHIVVLRLSLASVSFLFAAKHLFKG